MMNIKLRSLAELADILESQGNIVEANRIHQMFVKVCSTISYES